MNNLLFQQLSQEPGFSIHPETGEVCKIETDAPQTGFIRPGSYAPSCYSQTSIDIARATTSKLCEEVLAKITRGKRVKRGNNRGSDILLPDGRKLEAKVGRIGNSAVIKENQLRDDADYFGIIFYRTLGNKPPSFFTSGDYKSPTQQLLRNISLEVAYILPKKVITYYYNTAVVKRGIISTTGIAHRPLAISRAKELYENIEVPGERNESQFTYGRHTFPVKTIDFGI